jgi:hypothetical protein
MRAGDQRSSCPTDCERDGTGGVGDTSCEGLMKICDGSCVGVKWADAPLPHFAWEVLKKRPETLVPNCKNKK